MHLLAALECTSLSLRMVTTSAPNSLCPSALPVIKSKL
jgi:hypothetical protein